MGDNMKKSRQEKILEVIGARRIATQQELTDELRRRGIESTQSSISRDIVELGLIKVNGYYAAPRPAIVEGGLIIDVNTAGDNLLVIRTEIGQASPVAIAIDRANIEEIVGTVAGDDTILIAVKNEAMQRAAMKKIVKLFAAPQSGKSRRLKPGIARSLFSM